MENLERLSNWKAYCEIWDMLSEAGAQPDYRI